MKLNCAVVLLMIINIKYITIQKPLLQFQWHYWNHYYYLHYVRKQDKASKHTVASI